MAVLAPNWRAASSGEMTHIMHNRYLTYCYERLCEASGSLVTFGFRFGDHDLHIVDAINKAARRKKQERLSGAPISASIQTKTGPVSSRSPTCSSASCTSTTPRLLQSG